MALYYNWNIEFGKYAHKHNVSTELPALMVGPHKLQLKFRMDHRYGARIYPGLSGLLLLKQ